MARHSDTCIRTNFSIGGIEEMNKGGRNNYAGPKVAGKEVEVCGDANTRDSLCDYGKECTEGGDNEDDEESGNASTQAAIIVVSRLTEVADDGGGIGFAQIDS